MIDIQPAQSRRDVELAELRKRLQKAAEAAKGVNSGGSGFSRQIQEIREEVELIRQRLYELQFGV
jgi:chromosome segregation ATPase